MRARSTGRLATAAAYYFNRMNLALTEMCTSSPPPHVLHSPPSYRNLSRLFFASMSCSAVPMGVTSVLNVGCGLLALQLVNVPMFFCLRR